MLNILVTGANGQLGTEIKEVSTNYQYNFLFANRDELDITDREKIKKYIQTNNINTIINCAAYTAVDKAQNDKETAMKINFQAVKYLAEISKEKSIGLVHISSDYLFDGKSNVPYSESDAPNPMGVYGESKLEGEKAMQSVNPKNSIIIRTSWLYSSYGKNFLTTMLDLAKEKKELKVVYDQVGTPTYAGDLAKTILDILPKIESEKVEIYNYSNEGVSSWYDFAKEIMREAKLECSITPIETREYPTAAQRPHYSVLNKSKIKNSFNISVGYWRESLNTCLMKMKKAQL